MNIKQIIAEEVRQVLTEESDLLGALEALPEEEIEAALSKLLPLVQKGLPEYVASQSGVSEGIGGSLKGGLAKTLISVPGGRDIGAMYLAALDRATSPAIRIAFAFALANLFSPIDAGTLLSAGLLDVMGPLAALDDIVIIRSVLKKMKKVGLPNEKHHDRLDQLAGVESTEDPTDEMNEGRISKSALYKIIKEELEVVLTNEEASEMFDLDVSALLDEMMNEEAEEEEGYERPLEAGLAEEKPSAGLSKKKKSAIAKKAQAGDDIGKKGKGFDKVAAKAAKRYGSKEAGEKVAAAAMWKNAKR